MGVNISHRLCQALCVPLSGPHVVPVAQSPGAEPGEVKWPPEGLSSSEWSLYPTYTVPFPSVPGRAALLSSRTREDRANGSQLGA